MSQNVEFVIFGLTLLGVAIFHGHSLSAALVGLTAIVLYKLVFTNFAEGTGLPDLAIHFGHAWVTLANLMLLLVRLYSPHASL
jgi:hypothetical protein